MLSNIGFVLSAIGYFFKTWGWIDLLLVAGVWYIFYESKKHPIDNFWEKAKLYSVIALIAANAYFIYDSYSTTKAPKNSSAQLPL